MLGYLQRIGKSLMLPVAVLPVAAILMGVGYWIDPTGWGANNAVAAFLLGAGSAIIDNMSILFAVGVALGMAIKAIELGPDGAIVRNITLFAVLIYEIVGPFLTKIALAKAGDIQEEGRTSAREEHLAKRARNK